MQYYHYYQFYCYQEQRVQQINYANTLRSKFAKRSVHEPRSAQRVFLVGLGLSIKRVLTSTVPNIIQSAASTYFAKQSFPFLLPSIDDHSVYSRRSLLLILFGIRSVAPITPSRLCRFSKLVAYCTGRRIARGQKRMRIVKERGGRECNRCAVSAGKESASSAKVFAI